MILEPCSCLSWETLLRQAVEITDTKNITWGLIWNPQNLEDSCNMEQETISYEELGLEFSKLIAEQESKIW